MWELDCEESWALKNWCFWTVVLEKTLESPLACKEIQPVHPKGDQSWVFIGRTDTKAETLILWPPHAKSWFIGKDSDAGRHLGAWGEGDDRGWDGWMALPTRWTWVWVNSESWWWTGRPAMLRFIGSQRVGHDWVTEALLDQLWSTRSFWAIFRGTSTLNFRYHSFNPNCYYFEHGVQYKFRKFTWKDYMWVRRVYLGINFKDILYVGWKVTPYFISHPKLCLTTTTKIIHKRFFNKSK